jgi:hypothetical protein
VSTFALEEFQARKISAMMTGREWTAETAEKLVRFEPSEVAT